MVALNKPVIDTQRIQRFHTAKKEHMAFFSAILWELTRERDIFKEAMQQAFMGLWQRIDYIHGKSDCQIVLYEIALQANQTAWEKHQNALNDPPQGHHLSRLFSGKKHLPRKIRSAISQLDSLHALLIVLRYVERKCTVEIAEIVKCHEAQVAIGLSEAMIELKRRLRMHIKSYLELYGLSNSELADIELMAV